MLARYRYRSYPTPGQAIALARTFGCARVVFNDYVRARQDARASGQTLTDSQVQSLVTAQAKLRPQRA